MKKFLLTFQIAIFTFSTFVLPTKVQAQEISYYSNQLVEQIQPLDWPTDGQHAGSQLQVVSGTSHVYQFDRSLARVAVSDTAIADVIPISKKEILLYSRQPGRVNLIVWDEYDGVASYNVEATVDTAKLNTLVSSLDPTANVQIVPFKDTFAIYGTAETAEKVQQIEEISTMFHEDALAYVSIEKPKQVLLEVRFAEINRSNDDNYKFDIEFLSQNIHGRSLTGQTGGTEMNSDSGVEIDGQYPKDSPLVWDGLSAWYQGGVTQSMGNIALTFLTDNTWFTPVINYMESKNMLKIIARPNLLAKDGERATFLVGGEFAIPVSNDGDVSVDYREYGTRLEFTPTVIKDELIRLNLRTTVSELDWANSIPLSSTTEIPSLITREQETVSELRNGQSLVIGGMLTQRVNRIFRKVPLLGDIPVLDRLFSSESHTRTDVELLVVITPHIIEPFDLNQPKEYYDPEKVKEGVKVMQPMYEDPQGDAINSLIVQNEEKGYFDQKHQAGYEAQQKKIEEQIERQLKRDMDKVVVNDESKKIVVDPVQIENKSNSYKPSNPTYDQDGYEIVPVEGNRGIFKGGIIHP